MQNLDRDHHETTSIKNAAVGGNSGNTGDYHETTNNTNADVGGNSGTTRDHHETANNTNADVGGNSGTQINKKRKRDEEEKCNICCNDVDVNQMHENMFCHHRYCFSCMAKHVEFALSEYGQTKPKCPYHRCNSELTKDDCEKFLSAKWLHIFIERLEEAKIPDSEKVYCPYSNCSVLMALSKIERSPQPISSSSSQPSVVTTTAAKCQKCNRLFCIQCRVPWHNDMSCNDYASQLPDVDAELKLLAENKKWKQCPICRHMIELSEGCEDIICRCGFGFCYECGLPWKDENLTSDRDYCKCSSIDNSHHYEDEDNFNNHKPLIRWVHFANHDDDEKQHQLPMTPILVHDDDDQQQHQLSMRPTLVHDDDHQQQHQLSMRPNFGG